MKLLLASLLFISFSVQAQDCSRAVEKAAIKAETLDMPIRRRAA